MGEAPFRVAGSQDAEAVMRLINNAFRAERFFIDEDRVDLEAVRTRMAQGEFLLVEEDGALVGCVYLELRGERGYFGLLAVDRANQRSGLGTRLMKAAEDRARAAGCRFMDLTVVNLRKELPAFYGARGYVESGTEAFPASARAKMPCHLVKMTKVLGD
ncbi:MAG TPA: GNAT family N-acetyltransferase [Terriglobales bacterium]|nr:GNAT family N-acetyltransferase [Terriglobales bacterium]